MSENETKNDVVKAEEYNKVVEAHNNLKIEKEKVEKELKDFKEVQVVKMKEEWNKEKEEVNKRIDEIKKMAESKANAKGIVNENKDEQAEFKQQLEKVLPEARVKHERLVSAYARLKHYKSPITKQFTKEELGMGIKAGAIAQRVNPDLVPKEAQMSQEDIILRKRF